ncbi:MAG: hypothetical protein IT377_26700 [Polyangiaceae bacterium]|nr:hypothetical protein [Polyangiaceae bacterium]
MALASWQTCTAREWLALGLLMATASCSSQYRPHTGPRLSVLMDEGGVAYERDGQRFKHGFAGGGLVEAVEDDPEAKQAAERYQSRMTSGLILYLVGTGCLVTGTVVGLSTIDERDDHSDKDAVAAGGLLCGVAGLIAGASLLASGMPYQWDAINIYNDNLEKRRAIFPLPGPPGFVPYAPIPAPVPAPAPAPVPPPPPAPPPLTPGTTDAGALDAGG